jgi:hypothetical protein
MLYVRLACVITGTLFTTQLDARPLVYQRCAETHLNNFRKGELDAAKELLNSLVALKSHPEMQETVRKNYAFGVMLRKQNLDLVLKISKDLCMV